MSADVQQMCTNTCRWVQTCSRWVQTCSRRAYLQLYDLVLKTWRAALQTIANFKVLLHILGGFEVYEYTQCFGGVLGFEVLEHTHTHTHTHNVSASC